ncbi:MAG TPA: hypothetical protein VE153_28725 [Myxococcus sp.]|nr:hypothetical protein [Myxococcus sp.]
MSRLSSWKSALSTTALLTTLGAALPAAAQIIIYPICYTPDLATCQKPGYLDSTCGKNHLNTCKTLLQNEYSRQYNLLTHARDTVVPSNLSGAGGVTTARIDAANWSSYYSRGLTASAEGEVLRTQAATLRNSTSSGPVISLAPRFWWINDGPRVGSCEELVYERYNSFGAFEDKALGLVDSPTDIWAEAFYGDRAIAHLPLRDSTGGSLGNLTFPPGLSPKNPFFEPLPREYPPGQTPYSFSSSVLATIEAGRAWQVWSWQRHEDLGWQQLGRFNEAQLKEGYELGKNHQQSIAARRRIWEEYLRAADACKGNYTCLNNANSQYGGLLYAQDQQIAFDFYFAQQAGCFTTANPTMCDWSPQFFWEQVRERVHFVRDADFQLCKRITRNDFKGGIVYQAVNHGVPGTTIRAYDWTSTPQNFMALLAGLDHWLRNLDVPTDPVTGKAVLARWVSDSVDKGDDWFGLNFSYEVGWGVVGMEGAGRVCNAQLQARASFNANAKILKQSVGLLDALAWLDTYTPDPTYAPNQTVLRTHAHLTVVGMSIYDSGWRETPLEFSIATNPRYTVNKQMAETYIPVLGVPVRVAGGVSGVVGLDAGLGGNMTRDCNVNTVGFLAKGVVKPYAQVDGWITASVNAYVLEVGVYGRLTLVRVDLPMSLELATQGTASVRTMSANTRLDMVLRTLDGRMGVFGRTAFGTYEKDLVKWQGPEMRSTLFEYGMSPTSLALLDARL